MNAHVIDSRPHWGVSVQRFFLLQADTQARDSHLHMHEEKNQNKKRCTCHTGRRGEIEREREERKDRGGYTRT